MSSNASGNFYAALFMLAVSVPFALAVGDIYVDPMDPGFSARDFPTGVIGLIVLLAGGLLVQSVRQLRAEGTPLISAAEMSRTVRHVLPLIAVGLLYVWLIGLVQYALPTLFATAAILAAFGNRGWTRLVFVPIIATALYYTIFFVVLGLYEAPGSLLEYDAQALFR